jgi:hypothetical protein
VNLETPLAAFVANARSTWDWLQIDSSEATIAKLCILLGVVLLLLLVLADVYRGEIQNQDFEIGVTSHQNRFGYDDKDIVFTQQTFDIHSEKLPADINIFHTFTIVDGEKRIKKRVKVVRRAVRLRMVRTSHRVEHGQIALSPSAELAVKNRAEVLQRNELRRYVSNAVNRLSRTMRREALPVSVDVHSYVLRIHFSASPWFLLFMHPDRDVKATGWLTLLTSLFAVLTEFLF